MPLLLTSFVGELSGRNRGGGLLEAAELVHGWFGKKGSGQAHARTATGLEYGF